MTASNGHTVTGRTEEIDHYVAAVREALADLPAAERDELLEDLPAHLAEIAAEDPTPLVERVGEPWAYAAELRAAADLTAGAGRRSLSARLAAPWERHRGRLRRLDITAGPLFGYERFSHFARLLVPAWWVVRGYLAAMFVVWLLDRQGSIGLLPRLGGSTLAGLVILGGFVAGSVWLARRAPALGRWPRRAVYLGSALLVLFGVVAGVGIDQNQRWGWRWQTVYMSDNPYEHVRDVYVVDENDQLLTNVRLLDQDGQPIDIGWIWCDEHEWNEDEYDPRYPRCAQDLPFWARVMVPPTPTPEPTATPTPEPSVSASPGP